MPAVEPMAVEATLSHPSPFFSIQKCDRFREYAELASMGIEGISWKFWDSDWTLDKLDIVFQQLSRDSAIYIGIAENPVWRWELCREHDITSMKAHADHYETMYVLCVDCCDAMQVLEEHMILHLRAVPGVAEKMLNDAVYRPGPVQGKGIMYFYVCTI